MFRGGEAWVLPIPPLWVPGPLPPTGAAGTEYVQCTACSLRCTYGHSDNAGRADSARRASREKLPIPRCPRE